MCYNEWWYVLVADFVALLFQVTRTLKRAATFEFTTISAIKYTTCYGLIFLHLVIIFVLFLRPLILQLVP